MTDTREQVERLAQLADAWGEVNLAQGREGQSGDMSEIATTLRALLSRLEAAEAERDRYCDEAKAERMVQGALRQGAEARATAAEAERDAAVAAAYEAAAQTVISELLEDEPDNDSDHAYNAAISHAAQAVLRLTPADAKTALDRVKAEEREACAKTVGKQADQARAKMNEARRQVSGRTASQWATISAHLDKAADAIREGK